MCDCYRKLTKNITNRIWLDELSKLYSSPHFDIRTEGDSNWQKYMDYVLSFVELDGYWMEFGVWAGRTIKHIASQAPCIVYGFDSFEGLQEDWGKLEKKMFDRKGNAPLNLPKNVKIITGYFEESLPVFLEDAEIIDWRICEFTPCSFLHIDSDLYSSAKTILNNLKDRIVKGTVIAFDDFHNWGCCLEGEFRALPETDFKWRYIAHTGLVQSAIIIQ